MKSKRVVASLAAVVFKIVLAVVVIMVIYKVTFKCYDFGYRVFAEPAIDANGGREVTVSIVEGKSAKEIGKVLESKGLIRDADLFYIQELLSGEHGKLKGGVYILNTNMTSREMLKILANGSNVDINDDDL